MTERSVTGRGPIEDPPVDVREIAAADELLDALGRGAEVPEDDQLAGLLAAWRADLDADLPGEFALPDDLDELGVDGDTVSLVKAAPSDVDGPEPDDDESVATVTPLRPRSPRMRRFVVGIAAAAVLLTGFGVGVGTAGPDSPLWPIAKGREAPESA